MGTSVISTGTVSSMITDSIVTIDVECPPLPLGVGRMCLDRRMTGALVVFGEGFQSIPGNQALMRDPFSFKVWSTGTELTEKVTTEMHLPAAEYTFRGQNALVELSGPLRFLPTSGWRLESVSSLVSPSPILGLKTTEWLSRLAVAMMKWP